MKICKDCGQILRNPTAQRCKSCAKKGFLNPGWNEGRPHCLNCGKQIAYDRTYCKSCSKKGDKNPMFGKFTSSFSDRRQTAMSRFDYIEWRNAIYKRDGFVCQICNKIGGILNADHIKPWIDFPELRYEISNGRTLCKECHSEITKVYLKFNWKNQFSSARQQSVV